MKRNTKLEYVKQKPKFIDTFRERYVQKENENVQFKQSKQYLNQLNLKDIQDDDEQDYDIDYALVDNQELEIQAKDILKNEDNNDNEQEEQQQNEKDEKDEEFDIKQFKPVFKSTKEKKEEKIKSKIPQKVEDNKKYSLDDYVKSELKKKLKQTILSFDEDDN